MGVLWALEGGNGEADGMEMVFLEGDRDGERREEMRHCGGAKVLLLYCCNFPAKHFINLILRFHVETGGTRA